MSPGPAPQSWPLSGRAVRRQPYLGEDSKLGEDRELAVQTLGQGKSALTATLRMQLCRWGEGRWRVLAVLGSTRRTVGGANAGNSQRKVRVMGQFSIKGFLCVPFPFQETFTVRRPGTAQHHGDSRVGDRRGRGCETLMQPINPSPPVKDFSPQQRAQHHSSSYW